MKLKIPIEVDFDDMKSLIDDIGKLQKYKLFEGDELVLVNADDVLDVLVKHIKAQSKTGKWIKAKNWGIRCYQCDQCGNYLDFDGVNAGRGATNFCPNCGADMRENADAEE